MRFQLKIFLYRYQSKENNGDGTENRKFGKKINNKPPATKRVIKKNLISEDAEILKKK